MTADITEINIIYLRLSACHTLRSAVRTATRTKNNLHTYANTKVRATVNFFGPSSGDTLLLCWSDLRLLFFPTEEICFVGMDQASFLIYCSTVIMLKRWPYWYLTLEGYIAESYLADWSNQSPIRYLVKLYRAKFCHAIKVSCHQNCPWSK